VFFVPIQGTDLLHLGLSQLNYGRGIFITIFLYL